MIRHVKRAFRWALIVLLFLLGIAGFLLPIIPGFVFFAAAIALLATESHSLRRRLRWLRRRFPRWLRRFKIPVGPTPSGLERTRARRDSSQNEGTDSATRDKISSEGERTWQKK